ncbi:hypothetical protein C5167_020209 [Papaver somniferum]|uniref:Uncharacterized protein n=1 Tax=Papaver somniferum TaxID=3469 RepID=A0A4Y7IWA0_PAPSO|nr:hypothetical protein C5167_020209 [Papaver somniferum]
MSLCTDMASAWWANICTLGDTYIERNYRDCCCRKPPPSSPTSPSLPADPSSAPNFTARAMGDICKVKQPYIPIEYTQSSPCALNPQCENKCKEKGFVSAGSQCMGTSGDGYGQSYTWMEQCCCAIPPQSCIVDSTIYITKTAGYGCNVTISMPDISSPTPGCNETLIRGKTTGVWSYTPATAICFDELLVGSDDIIIVICDHAFHSRCLAYLGSTKLINSNMRDDDDYPMITDVIIPVLHYYAIFVDT